jgi:hypothetical protein
MLHFFFKMIQERIAEARTKSVDELILDQCRDLGTIRAPLAVADRACGCNICVRLRTARAVRTVK